MISYLSGEGQSEALYNNLYGEYNPSGRLCETWINDLKQNPYMEEFTKRNTYYTYCDDDIYVGYRYYDEHKEGFILPFGYGLSYTEFKVELISYEVKENIEINLKVKNTGEYDGNEVVQVYVGKKESSIYRVKKELKGFEKVFVKSHQEKEIKIILNKEDLTSYDEEDDTFKLEKGNYQIYICKNAFEVIDEFEIYLDGEELTEHLEMKKLIRKSLDKDYSFNTPGKFLFNNEKFKKFIVDHHIDLDLTDFEKKFEWISEWPFRSISEHFHMSYEQMDELIKYLNSFSHEEVSRG